MTRIFLLNPPALELTGLFRPVRQIMNALPSLGICSLGACLRQAGFEVILLDAAALGDSEEECLAKLQGAQPDIVGMTTYSVAMARVYRLAARIKKRHRESTIIVGGPHVSAIGTGLDNPGDLFDFVVRGEGELTLTELVQALVDGSDYRNVPGILFRSGSNWIETGPRKQIEDLDALPLPAWDLLPDFPDRYRPPVFSYPRGPSAPLITSRGCPFQCGFCDHSVFGYRYRSHSVDRIMDMICHLRQHFGVNHILFVDDHLSVQRSRLHELCRQLIERDLGISWTADVRADSLTVDDLQLMKRAGCVRLNCGLETGSLELLGAMHKKLDLEQARQTLAQARILGIQTKGLFLLGYPGENEQTVRETIQFIGSTDLTEINLSRFAPYPGTSFYETFRADQAEIQFWEKLDGLHFCDANPQRVAWLEQAYRRILHAFYHRPIIINSYLRLLIRMPESRARLLRFLRDSLLELLKKGWVSLRGRTRPAT